MVKVLLDGGQQVVTLDDLSSGYRDAVLGGELVQATLGDRAALEHLFAAHRFDAVMHFASFIQVGESVRNPSIYYRNNLSNTLNLLDAMVAARVLCRAHVLALEFLDGGGESAAFNLGNGSGFSVLQVIAAVEKVSGRKIRIVDAPRRDGDPACLVADARLAQQRLGRRRMVTSR